MKLRRCVIVTVPLSRNYRAKTILASCLFDDKILILYAKEMTTRDFVETFHELYGADISLPLVSNVTEAVLGRMMDGNRGL